ncbi:MAG: hypothetical protein COS82_04740 [Zetaproteobacteria bacterium CG06_land_8_20_14_3_00_59_53]|nr:MAG: hypothetical protein AUK36_08035 [Zetaproteobacteria bacterium CG2_30_59_37]PIO88926.1 MAG: hypothetical protein COX56_10845 [Zetaproteobacteria bacterium CG23_combo_of_CG06-09_8_20_14_all_59_86]PIQ65229.1 MAG: hypothetical protein COV97_05425 [Zetaproteobacteria bacterium CG11_big_fil_rev_8_21_14_0_20_59_439]PIU70807.1 MAG: hypothetical protein COS82_04740 [Zetaproteobacteria bacterium CG06_land_8_20_14_3_00_59_53]PIU96479.1 MAG: hypothetical protein COS62_09075 [Zetaproteobacteria bac
MAKQNDNQNHQKTSASDEQALLARRRLLKIGAYVPPAIVGMAVIGSASKAFAGNSNAGGNGNGHAYGHSIGSCMPSACQPCLDYDDEEGKDKNSHNAYTHQSHKMQCDVEKAKKDYNDKHKK